jgi:hypothetical protein
MVSETIKIHGNSQHALALVGQLKGDGLVAGRDFDWKYSKIVLDIMTYDVVSSAHTDFTFYNPQHATLYALRWL